MIIVKKWLLLILLVLVVLVGFPKKQITYPLSQSSDAIVTIEIVTIHDYRIINTGNFDMIEISTTIDSTEHAAFLTAFESLCCYDSYGPSQECLEGNAVRFTYRDGAFEIVGAETSFYCNAEYDWSYSPYYFDYDEFNCFLGEIVRRQGTVLCLSLITA